MKQKPFIHELFTTYATKQGFLTRGHYIYKECKSAIFVTGWVIGSSTGNIVLVAGFSPIGTPSEKLNEVNIGLKYSIGCQLANRRHDPSIGTRLAKLCNRYEPITVGEATATFNDVVAPDIELVLAFGDSREGLQRALHLGDLRSPEYSAENFRQGFLTPVAAWRAFGLEL